MPEPGRGEVLVEVRAAGVNPVDWKVREGMHRAFLPLELPAVLGREVAGLVVRSGPGFEPGDRICGPTIGGCGGYAEFAVLPAERAARMPAGLSFTDAAVLPIAAGTAYDALEALSLRPGESLLILGVGGGVGTVAAQLAVMRGIDVAGTASAAKRVYVESLGVVAYDHDQHPERADVVLDLVGGDALHKVAGALTDSTRILTVADPDVAAQYGASPLKRSGDPGVLAVLTELVANGKLDPGVRNVFPFAEAGDALALVEAGHVAGKVVIGLPTGPRR
ncbi:NADPH:quinone reductase-like Zn-dependent oxidoreductase [Kribbella sp. VKM Ac-2527]|uniref:NADPH:quinone reductase-like Zn-dependent oxidoreductase n=1 Tax=Kribbella caucasensis TaxID=2512215 RepID=A0A4R6J4W5_9ACTN|nr:NADP-dependent oxidoreductase [Kribbella sp. VKM Ac-2527]TDO30440.1 NADPH:quinone reductase-like Zn-dependent oxidoreductase [Kribbella sp. VKM Ac-2527]